MTVCSKPTRGRYVAGCRCEACCAENTLYIIRYRNRGSTFLGAHPEAPRVADTMLEALCWCEADSKPIPVTDVAAGLTWSCGPDCQATTT